MQCRGDNEGRVRVSAQQSILTWEFRCAKKYRLYRLQRPQAKKSIKNMRSSKSMISTPTKNHRPHIPKRTPELFRCPFFCPYCPVSGNNKFNFSKTQAEGNVNVTLNRSPSIARFISIFCSLQRLAAMARPNPLPSVARALSPRTKRSVSSSGRTFNGSADMLRRQRVG